MLRRIETPCADSHPDRFVHIFSSTMPSRTCAPAYPSRSFTFNFDAGRAFQRGDVTTP